MNNNLEFWDKVRTIPAKHIKAYKGKGGFTGDSYDAMYLIETMTNMFGPIGQTWGYEIQDHFTVKGKDDKGQEFATINVIVKVWCPVGFSYGSAANELYFTNKHGFTSDEEAFKKATTDAYKKGFSYLGFGADLWLDKNKKPPTIYQDKIPNIETAKKENQALDTNTSKKLADDLIFSINQAKSGTNPNSVDFVLEEIENFKDAIKDKKIKVNNVDMKRIGQAVTELKTKKGIK